MQDSHAQLQWQAEAEKRVHGQQRHLDAAGRQLEAARAREVALQTKLDASEAHARRADAQAIERSAAAEAGRAAEARAAAQSALVAEALQKELGESLAQALQVHDQSGEHAHFEVQPAQGQLPPPPQPPDEVQAETLGKLESETSSLKVASLTRHVESMELHIDSLEQQLDRAELHVAGVQVRALDAPAALHAPP